jgi:hypothetical protein
MQTYYRGIYQLGSSGMPSHIQVVALGGHSLPLTIKEYESSGVLPDWRDLPTKKQRNALVAICKAAQGASSYIKCTDAKECADCYWSEPLGKIARSLQPHVNDTCHSTCDSFRESSVVKTDCVASRNPYQTRIETCDLGRCGGL